MASKKELHIYPVIESGRRGSLLGSQNGLNLITCAKTPNKANKCKNARKELLWHE